MQIESLHFAAIYNIVVQHKSVRNQKRTTLTLWQDVARTYDLFQL